MKGGIAGMLYALQILGRLGVHLAGDVVFCTNTDEESSGAGSAACVARGVKADAGLCAEPTGFAVSGWPAVAPSTPRCVSRGVPATPRCLTPTGARAAP